jgi:hypothetical protein
MGTIRKAFLFCKWFLRGKLMQVEKMQTQSFLYNAWKSLAYRHKWTEVLLYIMFFSGLLIWPVIAVAWQIKSLMLVIHMLVGISVFLVIVGAFWSAHRTLLKNSKKRFLSTTGSVIEYLLIICSISGIYLFFYGNPGNALGILIQDIHFYSSWLLAPLVFAHALRWSVLNLTHYFNTTK